MLGLFLIGLILIGFSILNAPSDEEIAQLKRQQDSIARVENAAAKAAAQLKSASAQNNKATLPELDADSILNDSIKQLRIQDQLGDFATAAIGKEELITIENNVMKVTLSSLGGSVKAVELKKYKTAAGKPVRLFESDSTHFGLNFFAQNRSISTNNLYFQPQGKGFVVSGKDSSIFSDRKSVV